MQDKKKVIVAGHVCLDITPVFTSKSQGKLEQIMIPGKLIHMDAADVHTGGVVANTGLAMKFLGADVKLMGKVGEDKFGQSIQSIFSEYDVHDGLIIDENSTTSYSVVIAAPGVDRIFLHHPGANDTFSCDDIKDEMLEDVVLFHFGYPPLMKRMFENEGEELVRLFKRIKDKGIVTSLDMAAVDEKSEAGKQDWKRILEKLLPYVDFFLPSVEELCYMIDTPRFKEWVQRADGGDITEKLSIKEDVEPLGKQLIEMGANIVLIKCGAPGLYYRTASEERIASIGEEFIPCPKLWCDQHGFEKSYQPDCIKSTTGAGDTTIAAFLTATLYQYPLVKCLQYATATGASNVTEYDALSGLKVFEELEEKINQGWKKSW